MTKDYNQLQQKIDAEPLNFHQETQPPRLLTQGIAKNKAK